MSRYAFDRRFADVIRKAGIDLGELLRRSHLPEDLFARRNILLTQAEYFRLVATLGTMEADCPGLTERIALDGQIETFSPPVFAACCSDNGATFLQRFSHYKKLVGPVQINVCEEADGIVVSVASDDGTQPLPKYFARLELLFLIGVLRKATQRDIQPLRHTATSVVLSRQDLALPFVSRNDEMWQYFEPELRRRLSEMDIHDTVAARVRSALTELLPAGKTTIGDVAAKLFVSKRTLQRKLAEENTTFQQQFSDTRMRLAKNYLNNTDRTSDDIAFLLGYEDTSSFLRAFAAWTGMTVTEYKTKSRH